jgi:hypothetical protein
MMHPCEPISMWNLAKTRFLPRLGRKVRTTTHDYGLGADLASGGSGNDQLISVAVPDPSGRFLLTRICGILDEVTGSDLATPSYIQICDFVFFAHI